MLHFGAARALIGVRTGDFLTPGAFMSEMSSENLRLTSVLVCTCIYGHSASVCAGCRSVSHSGWLVIRRHGMLAAMTLTLAHSHVAAAISYTTPPPPPYNPTLYATAATIIPVLFLAIGVQSDTYKVIIGVAMKTLPDVRGHNRALAWVLMVVASVPAAGIGGEITAILVLAWGHADFTTYRTMLSLLIFLVVVAALPLLVQFGLFAREALRYTPTILADSSTAADSPAADSPVADSPGDVGAT